MGTLAPIRIPVCNADGVIVERVDAARARRLAAASNVTVVRKRKGGGVVRILLESVGDDSLVKKAQSNPKKLTYLDRSDLMPQGVHSLKHLPNSTESLYCTVRTDCFKAA